MQPLRQYTGPVAAKKGNPAQEAKKIEALIREILGVAPKSAGGMIGWYPFRYRYESGREGDTFRVAMSARAAGVSVYVNVVDGAEYLPEKLKATLGKVDVGKSCIRIKRVEDIDMKGFKALLLKAAKMKGAGEIA